MMANYDSGPPVREQEEIFQSLQTSQCGLCSFFPRGKEFLLLPETLCFKHTGQWEGLRSRAQSREERQACGTIRETQLS